MNTTAWNRLKEYTTARVALGKAGNSLRTDSLLQFRKDHALARDAVWMDVNYERIRNLLDQKNIPNLQIQSCALDRKAFIQRPDLGRVPNDESILLLKQNANTAFEISISIAEGLSAVAIENHALPFLECLLPKLNYCLAPIVLVEQGRVAISDAIGHYLGCKLSIILIGERPGLSSINSMGIYLTYNPQIGNTDEKRNCISNVRQEGLSYEYAVSKLSYLLSESLHRKISGVPLKDDFDKQLPQ